MTKSCLKNKKWHFKLKKSVRFERSSNDDNATNRPWCDAPKKKWRDLKKKSLYKIKRRLFGKNIGSIALVCELFPKNNSN